MVLYYSLVLIRIIVGIEWIEKDRRVKIGWVEEKQKNKKKIVKKKRLKREIMINWIWINWWTAKEEEENIGLSGK